MKYLFVTVEKFSVSCQKVNILDIRLTQSRALIAMMGKTADSKAVQKTLTNTLHMKGKPQKVAAERAGCSQRALSKYICGKLSGREKCGRKTARFIKSGVNTAVYQVILDHFMSP